MTLSVHFICLQHVRRGAARRAGLSAQLILVHLLTISNYCNFQRRHAGHYRGPGRSVDPVCACIRTITFERNDLWRRHLHAIQRDPMPSSEVDQGRRSYRSKLRLGYGIQSDREVGKTSYAAPRIKKQI